MRAVWAVCQGEKMTESKRCRVFVVDDEPVIGFTLATILESAGYTARCFSDPLDALRAAETNCPDYLLSDVVMPKLNGIDLGIQFKVIYPKVRVLLFSGVASTAVANRKETTTRIVQILCQHGIYRGPHGSTRHETNSPSIRAIRCVSETNTF
jgi:CheY-like chemotaxis protein